MTAPVQAVDAASAGARAENLARMAAARKGAPASAAADKAAKSFEALFLSQLMQTMFAGVKTNGTFGGGHAEKLWRDVLAEKIAEAAADRGGFGVAEAVRRQIAENGGEG